MSSKQILAPALRTVSNATLKEPNHNSAAIRSAASERRLVAVEVGTSNGKKLQYGTASGAITGGSSVTADAYTNLKRF